jgi:hypothetical protein
LTPHCPRYKVHLSHSSSHTAPEELPLLEAL